TLGDSADVFFALGDRTRLGLVSRLGSDGPMSIAGLTRGFDITRQAVTKHLRVLEDAGLVRSVSHGRETIWQLDGRRLTEARRHLDTISSHWDQALARLKQFVE